MIMMTSTNNRRIVMKKVTLISMLAIVMVAALAVPAQAVLVRNTNNNELVFFDDFEEPAPNADANNGAYPGSWMETGGITSNIDDQASAPGGIAPFEQSQMIHVNPGTNAGSVEGTFSSALTTGDTMHAEMAIYDLNPIQYGMDVRFATSGGGNAFQFYNEGGYVGSNAANFTSLLWVDNAWNTLEIDYTLGSTSMTVTLNGTSQTKTIAAKSDIAGIWLRHAGASGSFLVDAIVPEPATISLLALGGLTMLRRRRHA
jgi:hypothetical protein